MGIKELIRELRRGFQKYRRQLTIFGSLSRNREQATTRNARPKGLDFMCGHLVDFGGNTSDQNFGVVNGEIFRQVYRHGTLVKIESGLAPRNELKKRMEGGIGAGPGINDDAVFDRDVSLVFAILDFQVTGLLGNHQNP